jgi:hypothetical protein
MGQATMSRADHLTRNVETSSDAGKTANRAPTLNPTKTLKRSNDAGTIVAIPPKRDSPLPVAGAAELRQGVVLGKRSATSDYPSRIG